MQSNETGLFDLNFENWGIFLFSAIPALINLGIYFYVIVYFSYAKTNRIFALFVLLLSISQLGDGFVHMSNTPETAYLWNRISLIPWVFSIAFGFLFVLRFTEMHKKFHNGLIMSLLFIPAIITAMIIISRMDKFNIIKSERWDWIVNPVSTMATDAIYIWICIVALLTLFLLWSFALNKKNNKKRRIQILLLAYGYSIPFVLGIFGEVIMPLVFKSESIPLAAPAVTAFSIMFIIAITKFRFFDYSPIHQWEKIIENMSEGVLIVNNSEMIMYANKSFCKLTGYEFNEIKGKVASNVFLEEGKKLSLFQEQKDNGSNQFEIQLKNKSGENSWVLMTGSPYLDKGGKVIGSIGIQTNIENLKSTERKLTNANQELETYIYKASHDLKGPLSSILGLIQIGKMEVKDESSIKYLGMIEGMTTKLQYMLSELIKSMAIKNAEQFEDKILFAEIIADILGKFRFLPEYKRLMITKNIKVSSPFISSKFILESILQNLIENAMKYQDFEKKNSYLNISITEMEGRIKFQIADNGIGIDNSLQNKIFDMYFRATQKSKGSGLGLYLVKKGVEKLGGSISITSAMGAGSTFEFDLPPHP